MDIERARWVRVAVAVQYPTITEEGMLGEWFWGAEGQGGWMPERSRGFYLAADNGWHVYWTYLPAAEIGPRLDSLRFDPLNGDRQVRIGWIALSTVAEP